MVRRERIAGIFDQENPKLLALQKKVAELEKSLKKVTPPTTLVMVEMDEKRDTHVWPVEVIYPPNKKWKRMYLRCSMTGSRNGQRTVLAWRSGWST